LEVFTKEGRKRKEPRHGYGNSRGGKGERFYEGDLFLLEGGTCTRRV